MEKRSRHFVLISVILIALLASAMSGCGTTSDTTDADDDAGTTEDSTEASGEPYVIGAVLSLTGAYADWGDGQRNTIEMEVERINASGGINGRPLEVIIEDDATDADQALAATTRLIDQENVLAIIGSSGTGASMAMRGEINRAGIAQVSLAGASVITADFDPLVFQMPWPNGLVVPATLGYMQDQGITKVALIADSGGFGGDGVAVTEGFAADFGIEIVASETFNTDDTDMTAQLTNIKASDAEAIWLWSAAGAATTVVKNAATLEIDIPLFGSHGNANPEFIAGSGDAAEGVRFPAGKILIPEAYGEGTEGYEVATDYLDRFEAAYGEVPSTFAGHAYDGLWVTVNAMRSLDEGFTSADLRDAIEATDGFIGIGGTFTFSADDHNGMSVDDLVMYEIVNGAWTLAE